MSNFNSADIAAFKDVWVFCEQREGKLMPTDFELISKGRDLADELGVNLCGLLLGGEGIESAAKELGGYGADKVLVCESPLLAVYNTDAYAKVICDVIEDLKPEAFLIGATNIGRDLGPRCAARLHTGLCADCTHLDVDVANYIQFLRESSTLDVDSQKWDMEDRNLKMTRPAFGGHREVLAMDALVRAVFDRLALPLERKGLHLKLNLEPGQVFGDRARLESAVENLASNALRYTPEGGAVSVRLERVGGWLRLAVDNDGPSLTTRELAHLFEPFYRGDAARSRTTGGTGLGLAIVRTAAAAHGGTCWAENRAGGVRIWMELPALQSV